MITLTYREAARRVRRSVITVKRWRRNGMPMGWEIREEQRVRVVDEEVLLAWWRDRLDGWPTHQYRLRKLAQARDAVAPAPVRASQHDRRLPEATDGGARSWPIGP